MPGEGAPKGAFDAETESHGLYVDVRGNWDGGGVTGHVCDGNGHIASGDGKRCYRETNRPAMCEVPYGSSNAEQLRKKIQRRPEKIIKHAL